MVSLRVLDLPLKKIVIDPTIQSRVEFDEAVAERYADLMADGVDLHGISGREFPVVFWDGRLYLLSDGVKRHRAHELTGRPTMSVEVRQGGRRDALLHAVTANLKHGLQTTPADRQHAAKLLFRDPNLSRELSDRDVARLCGISPTTAGIYRAEVAEEAAAPVQSGHLSDNSRRGNADLRGITCTRIGKLLPKLARELEAVGPEGQRALLLVQQAIALWEQDRVQPEPTEPGEARPESAA